MEWVIIDNTNPSDFLGELGGFFVYVLAVAEVADVAVTGASQRLGRLHRLLNSCNQTKKDYCLWVVKGGYYLYAPRCSVLKVEKIDRFITKVTLVFFFFFYQ